MFFSRFSKRERYLVYASIVIIACVLFDRVVFGPVMRKLNELNGAIVVQEEKFKKSMSILHEEKLILQEYKKYAKNVQRKDSDEEAIASFLSKVEKLAKGSLVVFTEVKPGKAQEADFYKKYTIEIEAEATVGHLADFMYRLEKYPQLFRVGEFRLSSKKNEPGILNIYMIISQILIK